MRVELDSGTLEDSDDVLASVEALPDPEIEQITLFDGEAGPFLQHARSRAAESRWLSL